MSAPGDETTDEPPEGTTGDVVEQGRRRPPDLVGTRPEWDPEALTPTETPRAVAGRLWAPADEQREEEPPAGASDRPTVAAPAVVVAEAPAGDDAPTYSRYSARFQFLLGALLAVGLAAVALLAAVLVGGKDGAKDAAHLRTLPAWSAWRPLSSPGLDAVQEIAAHVGHEYRQPNRKQLVIVDGGGLEIADLPVTILVQKPKDQGGNSDLLTDGVGVMYRMCGVEGPGRCRVPGGMGPATAMLLRREALELALYSFRYIGVSETVVMLPPTTLEQDQQLAALSPTTVEPGVATVTAPPTALLFRRDQPDVQAALSRPLRATLSSKKTPTAADVMRSTDASTVTRLTDTKAYTSKFLPANQDASVYLVLSPLGR